MLLIRVLRLPGKKLLYAGVSPMESLLSGCKLKPRTNNKEIDFFITLPDGERVKVSYFTNPFC